MRASIVGVTFFIVWMMGCASAASFSNPLPTRAPLSARQAVRFGLASLRAESAMGYLTNDISLVRGQLMTHAEARKILDGAHARAPKHLPERPVWCIVVRGNMVLHIPGGRGDPAHGIAPIPAHDILVKNMLAGVILDADSGGTLEQSGINPAQQVAIDALPLLSPGEH